MAKSAHLPASGLKLHVSFDTGGRPRLTLDSVPIPQPGAREVLVRMEAAPIHPADVMVLLGRAGGGTTRRALDRPLPTGLEGAGMVVAAGEEVGALLDQRVGLLVPGLGTYAQYCLAKAVDCMVLPDGIDARKGCATFTNPLTALAMVETLHQIGETALVHTAAASSLGQMLVRICAQDEIELVNVVRSAEQVEMLRSLGAHHICNSANADFARQLDDALEATGARAAFDAIGGGVMAGELLAAMERAAIARQGGFAPYGSMEMKRVYLYGRLDPAETRLPAAAYGMRWSLEGWAMPPVLEQAGPERKAAMLARIAAGLDGAFATSFGLEIALGDMINPDVLQNAALHRTGAKVRVVMTHPRAADLETRAAD